MQQHRSYPALASVVASLLLLVVTGCTTPQQKPGRPAKRTPAVARKGPPTLQDPLLVGYDPKGFEAVGDVVRLSAYNIQDFTDGVDDGYERTPSVTRRQAATAAQIIDEINPDILFVEEIESPRSVELLNQALKRPFPAAYITNFDETRRGTKRNIAMFSRLKPLRIREVDFTHVKDSPVHLSRGLLAAAFDLGDDHILLVYGVHLKSNFGKADGKGAKNIAKRKEQLKLLRAHAELVEEANPGKTWEIVVAGDMNVDPDLPAFAQDTSLSPLSDWKDLWRGRPLEERITIPTRYGDPDLEYPSACFDRVIVSPALLKKPWVARQVQVLQRGVDTENVFTLVGQSELQASDHYPVYVDIER